MTAVGWIRHMLGLDVRDRVAALEKRRLHNEQSVRGAVDAFKRLARDAER